jgi:hypothetical protein
MNERDALNDVAAAIDEIGMCLAGLSERLHERMDEMQGEHYGPGDAACRPVEDQGKWMRGARKELSLLLREIEGPNPPQAPRRNA